MSLKAIVRSIITENAESTVITEQFVVELVDQAVPCAYLGGVGSVRVIEDTDIDSNNHVKFESWSYNFEIVFDVTPQHQPPKYKEILSQLNGHATKLWGTEEPGELCLNLQEYFIGQDAPFQVEDAEYRLRNNDEVRNFRQMLNRKFGATQQLKIEAVLQGILQANERSNIFEEMKPAEKKRPIAPPRKELYSGWATFS